MATVQFILANKGPHVYTVRPMATVREAVQLMNEHKIGALVAMEDQRVVGIFTERDVLRRIVGLGADPITTRVEQVMSPEVICCQPDTDLDDASRIMRDRRIRHLPVCSEDGRLLGMISIGDLNAFHASSQEVEIHLLKDYVFGRA